MFAGGRVPKMPADLVQREKKSPLHFCRGVFRTSFNSDGPKSVPND